MRYIVLLDILKFSLEQFVKSSEIEESCGFAKEEGGTNCIYFIKHGVIVYG